MIHFLFLLFCGCIYLSFIQVEFGERKGSHLNFFSSNYLASCPRAFINWTSSPLLCYAPFSYAISPLRHLSLFLGSLFGSLDLSACGQDPEPTSQVFQPACPPGPQFALGASVKGPWPLLPAPHIMPPFHSILTHSFLPEGGSLPIPGSFLPE